MFDRMRGAGGRLLPAERLHVPTTAVLSIMIFTMLIVGAAGLLFANAAAGVARSVENRFVIQLPAPVSDQLGRAVAIASSSPGVRGVSAVPESEMRETLRRWIGEGASSKDLPVPALVTLDLEPRTHVEGLRARIERDVPGASLLAESAELEPLLRSLRSLQWLALSLVVLIIAATAAAVVLAARGAFDTHRPTIEIMHGIGATDAQLTRLFERKIAFDAAAGAALGSLAAAVAFLLVGTATTGLGIGYAAADLFGWQDALLLLVLPAASIALATAVARWTVRKALRESL